MSISGSLEDVSVADVMQFIHLGRRTGTLLLKRADENAMIGFHSGKLVSARSPTSPKLGDLLIDAGLVTQQMLDDAVLQQKESPEGRSLGRILISSGLLEEETLRQIVSQQIEQTISDLVAWDHGTFEFAVDDLTPIDNISLYPGEVVPDTDINTQMVLLEAARIFDERNRGDDGTHPGAAALDETHPLDVDDEPAESEVRPPADDVAPFAEAEARLDSWSAAQPKAPPQPGHVLQVVSQDVGFLDRLEAAVPEQITAVDQVELDDAGLAASGEIPPIVLVDLREGQATLEDIAAFHERRPRTPVIALVDRVVPVSQVYGAGALAALPAEVDAVVACIFNVIQSQRELARFTALSPPKLPDRSGVNRLRRVYGDLRSGLLSATVALNLMHIISESVERAALFLVRRDCLQALGAFGLGRDNRPLAELTRGMRLELDEPNVLIESMNSGEALSLEFDEAELPRALEAVLGRPLTGQVVVFPVLGTKRVIAVIYTDNGQVDRPIEDIDILELATAQVGMAFENELLRRQIPDSEI